MGVKEKERRGHSGGKNAEIGSKRTQERWNEDERTRKPAGIPRINVRRQDTNEKGKKWLIKELRIGNKATITEKGGKEKRRLKKCYEKKRLDDAQQEMVI